MWDNRTNKKNPKGPDYTCKQDQGTCKFELKAPGSSEYIPSEYKTAVWLPKSSTGGVPRETIAKAAPPPKPQVVMTPEPPSYEETVEGRVRHGVVCAMIEAGKTKEEIGTDHKYYVDLIMGKIPF